MGVFVLFCYSSGLVFTHLGIEGWEGGGGFWLSFFFFFFFFFFSLIFPTDVDWFSLCLLWIRRTSYS